MALKRKFSDMHLPAKRIHSYIGEEIAKGRSPLATDWRTSTKKVVPSGQSHSALYSTAKRRKVRGKSFFGHGSWQGYLEKKIGVTSTGPEYMPNKRLHFYIGQEIKTGRGLNVSYWKKSKEPVTITSHSPNGLYCLVKERKKNGVTFLGHGNWRDYLVKEHKVKMKAYTFGRSGPIYKEEELNKMVNAQIQKNVDLTPQHWKKNGVPIKNSLSLQNLYQNVQRRKKNGKFFLGHGNWYNYLRNVHKVNPLSRINMPNERLVNYIRKELEKGGKNSTKHWHENKPEISHTGQTREIVYDLVKRRGFLGNKSWETLIRKIEKETKNK